MNFWRNFVEVAYLDSYFSIFLQLLDEIAEKFYGVRRRNPLQGIFGDFLKVIPLSHNLRPLDVWIRFNSYFDPFICMLILFWFLNFHTFLLLRTLPKIKKKEQTWVHIQFIYLIMTTFTCPWLHIWIHIWY